MTTAAIHDRPVQTLWLMIAGAAAILVAWRAFALAPQMALLLAIGGGMGVALYHAAFGFTGAYRALIREKDLSGVTAQVVMLIIAMVLFAPVLAQGQVFGHGVSGAVAPVGVSMAFGAFIFGIGMQLGGGCGSGTLFTVGGGNLRMVVTLVFFCIGGFWGSLDLAWWTTLPEMKSAVAFNKMIGAAPAVIAQVAVLLGIYGLLRRFGFRETRPLWWDGGFSGARLVRGPWPLLFSGGLLAVFNWLTLLVAGHPWSITWAFSLWGAKGAKAFGWDPQSSGFWTGGYQERALSGPVLADTTSVMNIGIILGALAAAALAGRMAPDARIPLRPMMAAVVGGLMLGYGARLAYGCNIGAFFSGVASTSLHGWVWIIAAIAGNWIGVKVRPLFHLG